MRNNAWSNSIGRGLSSNRGRRFAGIEQLENRRMLALTATWGQCAPADDPNFGILDFCIDVRDPAGTFNNEVDDVRVGAIVDPAGLPPGVYALVEVKTAPDTYEALPFFSQFYQGTLRVVGTAVAPPLTSAVNHIQIQPRGGDDVIDTRGVTSMIDVGGGVMSPNYSLVNRWLIDNDPRQYIPSHSNNAVTIYGGNGADTIYGSEFGDCIKGADFEPFVDDVGDLIFGYAGDDHIEGKPGADTIYGGTGDDVLYGDIETTVEYWNVGGSDVDLGDEIYGEEGNDRILGQGGDDSLFGGSGDDEIGGQRGQDDLRGGTGDDSLSGGAGDDNIIYDGEITGDGPESTSAGDVIFETEIGDMPDHNDAILFADIYRNGENAGIHIDLIRFDQPQQINDHLTLTFQSFAISGDERIDAGLIERVEGTDFADTITGNVAANELIGRAGDDLLCGEAKFEGNDVVCDEGAYGGSVGNDVLLGMDGDDELRGGPGDDSLFGGNGDDLLYGETDDDRLFGEAGHDFLHGGDDNDRLEGGADADIMLGGAGVDTLIGIDGDDDIGRGGAGMDIFVDVDDVDQDADTVKALPVDLQATSDSGVSDSDDITNDNTPTFDVIAVPGTYVELYRATTPGGTGAVVASATFSQRGVNALIDNSAPADGDYYYYIKVADDPLATSSEESDRLLVNFDTQGPRVQQVTVATTLGGADASKSDDVEDGAGQLLRVQVFSPNRVRIEFDEDVPTPAVANLALTGQEAGTNYAVNAVTMDHVTFVASWELTTAITGQDQIVLLLDDAVNDIAGNPLDGFWVNPERLTNPMASDTYPSGNGTAGDFQFHFTVMPGDTNGSNDNIIDVSDLNHVRNQFGQTGPNLAGDADFDGDVDIADLNLVRNTFGLDYTEWPGGAAPLTAGGGTSGGTILAGSGTGERAMLGPVVGEEALRQLLRDEYFNNIAVGGASPFADLFGWEELGDADWWNDLLGDGWDAA